MVKKFKINWTDWFREYMVESTANAHAFSSFPYGLLITQILLYYTTKLSAYPLMKLSSTYDSKTFSTMGYVLVENK